MAVLSTTTPTYIRDGSGAMTTTYHEETRTAGPIATHKTTTVTERHGSEMMPTGMVTQTYSAGASGHYGGGSQMIAASHTQGRLISTVQGEARETGETHVIAQRTGEARYTGETRVVEQYQSGTHLVDTRVVGVEKGVERQISVTEVAVGEEVIGERTAFVGKGRRGKKVVREIVEEKTIVVPVVSQIEEWVEDEYDMEETVVEVAKKYQIEKIVEVPEIEIVEKIIEQVEKVVREKVVEVPKIQTVEKIVEIPVIQTVEKIVEVPEVQYRDIPIEKIVEVPEIKTEEVIREVKKANFVDKPIEKKMLIADARTHSRKLPVPVEAETVVEFTVPHLRANYVKKKFPVYLPRFLEVPVSRQFVDAGLAMESEKYSARIANLCTTHAAVSLCELEKLAAECKDFDSKHAFSQKKITMGGHVDEHTKRTMFATSGVQIEQYATYRHLPVEVSDLHIGHYQLSIGHEAPITYSSATFGTTMGAIGTASSYQHSAYATKTYGWSGTTHHLPSSVHQQMHTTHYSHH